MITTLFFDLDGTLLEMDEEAFVPLYMKSIAGYMAPHGLDPHKLIHTIDEGSKAMYANDGSITNEECFWRVMDKTFSPESRNLIPVFTEYYRTQFDAGKAVCAPIPAAKDLVEKAKKLGFRLVCASNPVFPKVAMEERLKWAGFNPEDFDFITSYETSSFSKLDPRFYGELCQKLDLKPEEVLMIGNSPREDGNAEKAGLSFYLMKPDGYKALEQHLEELASQKKS